MRATPPTADVAVIGGSGFYSMFDEADDVVVDTPYGAPSALLRIGEVAGRRVAFLPRHGCDHQFPRTASLTARMFGRCTPSASGRSWRPAPLAP